jgi:protoheme IX farnesyltransferase
VGVLGVYWLWLGIRGLTVQKPEKWARSMFGFSLLTLLVLSISIAFAPLLP